MSLKPFNKISMPSLIDTSVSDIKTDIIEKITSDSEWNEIWDGDLYQNAYQMILETFGYLFLKNKKNSNNIVKENFLNQALSPQAIYNNLANKGVQLQQNRCAEAMVQGAIVNDILTESLVLQKFQTIYGTNPNNESIPFEIIKKDNDDKYNYFDNIIITPSVEFTDYFEIPVFAGETFVYEYEITPEMMENFVINISDEDIIEDSIRIYYKTMANAPIEIPEADSFIIAPQILLPYFPNGIPHYIIEYNADGSANILFSSAEFGGAFEDSHIGNTIQLFGRKGGGLKSNVKAGKINYTLPINISQGRVLNVLFTNKNDATGGFDKEDVFKAQKFAPYRTGRGKPIIDAVDARSKTYSMVVKHEIQTPKYSDDPDFVNVPILHAYNKIVPKRDFSDFVFPDVLTSDTLATYTVKFIQAIQDFCNIQGTHDYIITDEEVTDFIYPLTSGAVSYSSIPAFKYPLSGSLEAVAYNYNGTLIDKIIFNSNYIIDQKETGYSVSSTPSEHAMVSSKEFSTVTIQNNLSGRNDLIIVSFDYDLYPYVFTIQLTTGIKTYKMLAQELQALIVADIDANASAIFGALRSWEFVTYEENATNSAQGKIIFNSPSYGINSKIEILDNGTLDSAPEEYNIYKFLDIEKRIYRPASQTGLVFDVGNTYKYNDNILTLKFKDAFDITKTKTYASLGIVIDHSSTTGPLLNIYLTGENADEIEQLFEEGDNDLKITAFNSSGVPVDFIEFPSISSLVDTQGVLGSGDEFLPLTYTPGDVFKSSTENKYYYSTGNLKIRLHDNVLSNVYDQSYPTIYRVDIVRIIDDPLNPGTWIDDNTFTPIQFLEVNGNYTQDVSVEAGKTVVLTLTQEQSNTIEIGDNLVIRFYHRDEVGVITLIENAKVYGVINDVNQFQDLPVTELVLDQIYLHNEYDRLNKTFNFKFVDGTLNTSVQYYDKGFTTFDHLTIQYKKKTYENIKINYKPNPYFPEGEAGTIANVLNNKANAMIGLENIIKRITFVPKPITIMLTIKKNFAPNSAIDAVLSQLQLDFGYDNENYLHTIGSKLTHQAIKNSINGIANDYGISDITISSSEDLDDILLTATQMKYKFIFDSVMYDRIRQWENSYSSYISGFANLYKINVTAVIEELII